MGIAKTKWSPKLQNREITAKELCRDNYFLMINLPLP